MRTPESVNPKTIRTQRDDTRTNNPRLRTVHDLWRDALVVYAKPTR